MKGRARKTDIFLVHAENPALPWLSEKLQLWDVPASGVEVLLSWSL